MLRWLRKQNQQNLKERERGVSLKENTITQDQVNRIYDESEKEPWCIWGKCLVLAVKLPNGFIIVESSSCVDLANFDIEIGKEIIENRIKNKIWELEGYKLQCKLNNY